MPFISMLFGLLLIALGVEGYTGTFKLLGIKEGQEHAVTALIPAGFGILLLFCGFIALQVSNRKHAMHFAAMVGLLGAIGGFWRAGPKLMPLFRGELADNAAAVKASLTMGVICLLFVLLCVNSFIQARKRRKAAERLAGM